MNTWFDVSIFVVCLFSLEQSWISHVMLMCVSLCSFIDAMDIRWVLVVRIFFKTLSAFNSFPQQFESSTSEITPIWDPLYLTWKITLQFMKECLYIFPAYSQEIWNVHTILDHCLDGLLDKLKLFPFPIGTLFITILWTKEIFLYGMNNHKFCLVTSIKNLFTPNQLKIFPIHYSINYRHMKIRLEIYISNLTISVITKENKNKMKFYYLVIHHSLTLDKTIPKCKIVWQVVKPNTVVACVKCLW